LGCLEHHGSSLQERRDNTTEWVGSFQRAEALAWSTLQQTLAENEGLSEAAVLREVVCHLPKGALLTVGNSLTIRHLDRYCPGGGTALRVCHQRGASGIDGLLSGAAGAASTESGVSALVLGDISFLHDLGGLAALATLRTPLLVCVLQNDGGRIFEQLPVAEHAAADGSLDYWLTPHGLCLRPAADLYSIPYLRVDSIAGLRAALVEGLGRPGPTLLEAIVPPQGAVAMWRSLQQSFDLAMEQA
jgi:2-succinyl-5-enolpyruvyl-6-hydroxy-3-cyclohexene-1-carboxylate synthase